VVIGPFAYEGEDMPVSEKYQVNPPYSLWKTVWKGLRPALWASGAAAGLVFAGYFADAGVLIEMGVPSLLAVFLAEAIRNAVKEYRRRK